MNITIPDKLYKLLILVGALLIAYGSYKIETSEKHYFSELDQYRTLQDSLNILGLQVEKRSNDIKRISSNLSRIHNVENPVTSRDSLLHFNRALTGSKDELAVSDSIQKLWLDFKEFSFQLRVLDEKLSFEDRYIDEKESIKESYLESFINIRNLGFVLFFLGCFIWLIDSEVDPENEIKQFEKVYAFCQSCARDFSSMRTYGNNEDGSLNYAFCSECYKEGKFIEPNLTKEEARDRFINNPKYKNRIVNIFAKIRFAKTERWT